MTDAAKLFRNSWGKKQEAHWPLCLAAYIIAGQGGAQRMADEYMVVPQTVMNYAKTYRLYFHLRQWVKQEFKEPWKSRQILELRDLRKAVDYSKWLRVAERVYHEDAEKRIDLPQALDFLRAGADSSFRVFAAIVGGNDITRTKAFMSAWNGIRKALLFPMPKREKRILMKAKAIAEKRMQKGEE